MYENITYESILKRMLDRIPSSFDKREGSVIYDAIAPAAVELQNMYIELDTVLNETFADTASLYYLKKRAEERGIIQTLATSAVLKGVFTPATKEVDIGTRFSCENLNYIVIEKIDAGVYKLLCETTGTEGNLHFGSLIPIDYVDGLETAELTELLITAEDDEEPEHLRQRYFDSFESQAFGGNVADYKEKTNAIKGVGGVKVYPTWKGGGTVRLVIINSEFASPSKEFIDEVQTKIDPVQNQGQGVGIAPIGHTVTVDGCGETDIQVQTTIKFEENWDADLLKSTIESTIDEYLKELSSTWEESSNLVVRISQIETRLLNLTGILDIENTTLNGSSKNLTIEADNIPVRRGDVTIVQQTID